ncbi:uncharacterized protein [Diadema setosum]|uniref:uncharacterized protein n=1 Tax=Diadema setosum TaxID=31175 RepID=UPI003B3AE9BD
MGCNQSKVVPMSPSRSMSGKRRFWSLCRRNKVVPLQSDNVTSQRTPTNHRSGRSPTTSDVSAEIARCMEASSNETDVLNSGLPVSVQQPKEASVSTNDNNTACADVADVDRPCSVMSRTRSRAGGFAFDLVDPEDTARTLKPAPVRLTKLKSRSRSLSGDELKTQIQSKMELARQKRELIVQRANTKMVDRELRAYDVKRKADVIRQEKVQRLAKKEEESNLRLELDRMEKEKKAEERRRRREAAKRTRDMRMVDEELAKLLK